MYRGESGLRDQTKVAVGRSSDVHLFCVGDIRLAFDVNSGSLHRLDEIAWSVLRSYLECRDWVIAEQETSRLYLPHQVKDAVSEIKELVEEGLLFSADPGWTDFVPGTDLGLKALCLNISHDCNLACKYCFVPDQLRSECSLMPSEVIRAAIDFLLKVASYDYLAVDFFGGEPLLNLEGIRFAVDYALAKGKHKKWKFTLTTNALLLNEEVISFLKKHNISLVLSCDGRPHVHDAYRRTCGGKGTSAVVEERLKGFLGAAADLEYYVRGTFTRHNLDFADDVSYIAGLGAKSISLEPVVSSPDKSYALRSDDVQAVRDEYFRLARLLRKMDRDDRSVSFYHFCLDLSGGPCVAKRLTGCGAGYQYLAVTPTGELYPCHQFAGQDAYLMGNVWEGVTNLSLQEEFRRAHVYRKEPCRSCWARFLCGGGCHAQAALLNGDLLKPNLQMCDFVKARLEGALYYMALGES